MPLSQPVNSSSKFGNGSQQGNHKEECILLPDRIKPGLGRTYKQDQKEICRNHVLTCSICFGTCHACLSSSFHNIVFDKRMNSCHVQMLQCVHGSTGIVWHTFSPLYDDISQNPFGHLTGTCVDLV